MDEKRAGTDRQGGIEGVDAAALGITPGPESAPEAARVDDDLDLVPGADFEPARPDEEKPWFTSLAAESDQAGVMNETLDPEKDVDRG